MSCVQVEVMPWLSRYVVAGCEEPVILEKEVGDGATVRELLEDMTSENQEFRAVIFDAKTGKLAGYVGLVLNGRFLELAGGVEATVKPGDVLRLMPGFSGG